MANKLRWLGLSCVLAFASAHCGGKAETDFTPDSGEAESAGAAATTSTTTGGTANLDDCADAGESEAGCGGEGGLACSTSVTVYRRGRPVPICFKIR